MWPLQKVLLRDPCPLGIPVLLTGAHIMSPPKGDAPGTWEIVVLPRQGLELGAVVL